MVWLVWAEQPVWAERLKTQNVFGHCFWLKGPSSGFQCVFFQRSLEAFQKQGVEAKEPEETSVHLDLLKKLLKNRKLSPKGPFIVVPMG